MKAPEEAHRGVRKRDQHSNNKIALHTTSQELRWEKNGSDDGHEVQRLIHG
jgi:hypothetical protein